MADYSDFLIENGVLKKYNGNDECVVLPDVIKVIGTFAFDNCESVREVIIPDGTRMMSFVAFNSCRNLESIRIPASLTQLAVGAPIVGCKNLSDITVDPANPEMQSVEGIWYSKDMSTLILYPQGRSLSSFSIPDGVEWIYNSAFSENEHLETVHIPDSVEIIGSDAFKDCKNLSQLVMPGSVISIENGAFWGCSNLGGFNIIPSSVRSIGPSAFSLCKKIETVCIPQGVTEIPRLAFAHCTWLLSVIIPDSVTKIDEYAFLGCPLLLNITLPESITEIGKGALGFDGTGFTLKRISRFTIHGKKGSAAELYAQKNNLSFKEE